MTTAACDVVRAAVAMVLLSIVTVQAQPQTPTSLATADAAMQSGRFEDAARQYEAWLAAHPDTKEVLLALGVCRIQLGRPRDAAAVLRRYVTLVPDSAAGHAALGVALLDGASTTDAKVALGKALSINPGQTNAIEALARIHLVEGDPTRAAELLQPLVESAQPDSQREDVRTLLAEALIRSGRAAAAAALLDGDLAASPHRSIQTYTTAAWARIKSGDLGRAAEICEQGMRLYPDSEIEGVYLSLPGKLLAERTAARLAALQKTPEISEMIALGRVLTDVDPARQTRANELARQLLSEAVRLAPANPSAHYNYGRAMGRTDMAAALALWQKALTLSPDDELRMQVYTQIAKAKDAQDDAAGAEAAFAAALEINRRLARRVPEAALEFVRFRQLHAQTAEAATLLDEIVGWNPWSPEARVERARLLADSGQWEQVAAEGEFVLRHAGEDLKLVRVAHLLLARAYFRLKQPDKAQMHRTWLESH